MVQWYEHNKQLFDEEVRFMTTAMPTAQYDFLQNGNMYWIIETHPIICGIKKDWTLLVVQASDHPQQNRGETIRLYPIKPYKLYYFSRNKYFKCCDGTNTCNALDYCF